MDYKQWNGPHSISDKSDEYSEDTPSIKDDSLTPGESKNTLYETMIVMHSTTSVYAYWTRLHK